MGWLDRLLGKDKPAPPPRVEGAPGRSGITLYISLPPAVPERDAETARLAAVRAELEAAYGGAAQSRAADEWLVISFDGDDVERMWEKLAPAIERHPFPRGSHAVKRDGLSGDEECVSIEWEG